ncbi:MAG: ATP-binding protein [Calditrichaeota bacterium]|nr:MAG: ATP-binding protein [Calditrichota bacterium]
MIKRMISSELLITKDEYPIITIIGPRQSGKTTLSRMSFPDYTYVNMEIPEHRTLAKEDPKSFLKTFSPPLIIDEIQNSPELLSWLQVMVDEEPNATGRYILTGSHQLKLREAISQSLAGRTAVLSLLPLSLSELKESALPEDRSEMIHKGFMPGIYARGIRPVRFYRDYFQTYVERDVRKLMAIEDQQSFELFMRLLAGRIGQEINYASLSNQVGICAPQIKKWLSILEASFLIFRLPPFLKNYGKRLTKSPKIYFTEVGLAAYLLGLEEPAQIERDPLFGNLFENLVIAEAYKSRLNKGKDPRLFFFRDNHQKEIDLLYPSGQSYIPVEIKSSRTYREDFLKNIHYFRKLSGSEGNGMLIYDGEMETEVKGIKIRNFRHVF